jgi:hypothetical protein
MRATLAYTSARILLFIASVAVLYLIGARGLPLLALALLLSGVISFVVLSRARDRMSASLTSRLSGARLGRKAGEPAGPASGDAAGADSAGADSARGDSAGGDSAGADSGEPADAGELSRASQPSSPRPRVLAGMRSRFSEFSQRLDEGTRDEDED